MDIRKNTKEFLSPAGTDPWKKTLSYLENLDAKLEAAERDLNYYDLYKIVSVVDNEEQLYSAKAALYPNTALIINAAQRISLDGESYKRGDLIVRTNDGSYTHVKSEAGGFWAPSQLTKSGTEQSANTYQLQYSWNSATPSDGTKILTSDGKTFEEGKIYDTPTDPVTNISLKYDVEGQMQIYGLSITEQKPFSFTAIKRANQVIWPVVKCFAANNEEVACEVRYTYDDATNTITYQ